MDLEQRPRDWAKGHAIREVSRVSNPLTGTGIERLRLAFEPIYLPARQMSREPSPAIGLRRNKGWQDGGVMHMQRGLWLDNDLGSLTVLLIGISVVALLAFSGF
jgi:hypothetical protein